MRVRPRAVELSGYQRPKTLDVASTPLDEAKPWYRLVENRQADSATVYIYDEIGFFGVTATDFVAELDACKAKDITFRINSPGGEVYDGLAIYNAIRNHPAKTTARIDGLAASAASFIAMAADRVEIERTGEMMIHDAIGMCFGNASEMRRMLDQLDRMSDNIAGIYADRAGGDAAGWRGLMRTETWYGAQQAVNAGLADAIAEKDEGADKPPAGVEVSPKIDAWRSDFMFANFAEWQAKIGDSGMPKPTARDTCDELYAETWSKIIAEWPPDDDGWQQFVSKLTMQTGDEGPSSTPGTISTSTEGATRA